MGKRLYLVRHGMIDNDCCCDSEKPLSARGKRDVNLLTKRLKTEPAPQFIFCSNAVSAIQTLESLMPLFPGAQILIENTLYRAPKKRLSAIFGNNVKTADTVMIIGHNTGLDDFLHFLTRNYGAALTVRPGGCAALSLKDGVKWSELGSNCASLNFLYDPAIENI